MGNLRSRWIIRTISLLALATSGCKNDTPNASTDCAANQAQVLFFANGYRMLCGCAEEAGRYSELGQSLTCTVNAGTQVFFNFQGPQNHIIQINSGGTSPFLFNYNPTSNTPRSFSYSLPTSGAYPFVDSTNAGILGQFIVP